MSGCRTTRRTRGFTYVTAPAFRLATRAICASSDLLSHSFPQQMLILLPRGAGWWLCWRIVAGAWGERGAVKYDLGSRAHESYLLGDRRAFLPCVLRGSRTPRTPERATRIFQRADGKSLLLLGWLEWRLCFPPSGI